MTNELTTEPAVTASRNGTAEKAASPLLLALIGEIQRSFQVRLQEVIQMGVKDAGIPAGARLDVERGMWILPPVAPE